MATSLPETPTNIYDSISGTVRSLTCRVKRIFLNPGPDQGSSNADADASGLQNLKSKSSMSRLPLWDDGDDNFIQKRRKINAFETTFLGSRDTSRVTIGQGLSESELYTQKLRDNSNGILTLSNSSKSFSLSKRPSLSFSRSSASLSNDEPVIVTSVLHRHPKFALPLSMNVRPENFKRYQQLHADKDRLLKAIKEWRKEHDTKTQLPPVKRIAPLGAAEKATVEKYWKSRARDDEVGVVHRVHLSVEDIQTLRPRAWLNDNVIDAYLAENSTKTKSVTFAFTTHFYTRLEQSGYSAVAKWAKRKKVNILELDFLVVPVNRSNMHWCVAIVDNNLQTISFYDSLSSRGGDDVVNHLVEYLTKEADRVEPGKHEQHAERFQNYKFIPKAECPQQENGFDCGVFACQTAVRISNKEPLDFDQADMNIIREHMAFNLLELAGAL